jgi:hypothetical protein
MSDLILRDYIEQNQDRVTSIEGTESLDYNKLFEKTYPWMKSYLIILEREEFIGNATEFVKAILETLTLLNYITGELMEYFDNLDTHKQEYFDDPNDLPIPGIGETLFFVKYENYMTYKGLITFDLNYAMVRLNSNKK